MQTQLPCFLPCGPDRSFHLGTLGSMSLTFRVGWLEGSKGVRIRYKVPLTASGRWVAGTQQCLFFLAETQLLNSKN